MSGCVAYDAVQLAIHEGEFENIKIPDTTITIEQRYKGAFFRTNPADLILGDLGRGNVVVQPYYRFVSDGSNAFSEFDVAFYYACEGSKEKKDVIKFSKETPWLELRGRAEWPGQCENRPYKQELIAISDEPHNGYMVNALDGGRYVGIFRQGKFVEGIALFPNGELELLRYNESGRLDGPWTQIEPAGNQYFGAFDDGELHGHLAAVFPDGGLSYSHYSNGKENTEEIRVEAVRIGVEKIEAEERRSLLQPLDQRINRLSARISENQQVLKRMDSKYSDFNDDKCRCYFTVCLTSSPRCEYTGSGASYRFRGVTYRDGGSCSTARRRYLEEAEKRDKAREQVCRSLRSAGITLNGPGSFEQAVRSLSLPKGELSGELGRDVGEMLDVYERTRAAQTEILRIQKERDRLLDQLEAQQRSEQERRNAEARAERIREEQDWLARQKTKHEEYARCMKANGYDLSTVDTWRVWPLGIC